MTPVGSRLRSCLRGRTLVLLLVVVLGTALGAGGIVLVHRFAGHVPARPAGSGSRSKAVSGSAFAAALNGAATAAPARPLSDQAIYARVKPSVVDVTAALRFDDETASGTGFVVDVTGERGTDGAAGAPSAFVLTNNHVIRDATSVTVAAPGTGRNYPARVVGVDVPADVAVLQIAPMPGLVAAPVGDSATVSAGATVLAIGNRAGTDASPALAPGVISGTGRTIQATDGSGFTETLHDMLATTTKIEPGDSGGPLASATGVVIGMDTAAGTGGAAPGYAIPINAVLAAARQIVTGHPGPGITLGTGGFLGVIVPTSGAASPHVQQEQEEHSLGTVPAGSLPQAACLPTTDSAGAPAVVAPARTGALVDGVLCGTAAAAAGIDPGDVITDADGQPVSSPDELTAIVSGCRPGTVVAVTWVSPSGGTTTTHVRLDAAPAL